MSIQTHSPIGFFGSIIVDRVLSIGSWPQEGALSLIEGKETLGTGGSAWNDPVNIHAIDPSVPLFSCGVVGDDAMGRYALESLHAHGIDTAHVEVVTDADTSYSIVSNSRQSGLRTHLHAKGACSRFGVPQIEAFPHHLSIAHLGYLLLLDLLEESGPAGPQAVKALELLQSKADKVAIDIVSLDHSAEQFRALLTPCLPLVDYLIINEFEAGQITNTELRRADGSLDAQATKKALRQLIDHGIRDTAIIHFPEGAIAATKAQIEFCPSFDVPREEINCVVGAGDAFASAVLYGFYKGMPLRECLLLGNANARHNITSHSCTDGVVPLATLEKTIRTEKLRSPIMSLAEF